MKYLFIVLIVFFSFSCQNKKNQKQTVELSCGQCQFDLTSQTGCDLAVRVDGKAYFVDGADIDDFGDAHEKDTGFCEAIRKAEIVGELIDNRFEVSSIELLEN